MADDPKAKDSKTTTHDKPWWAEMLTAMPKWALWFTGIGLLITLVSGAATAAYGTENGRRLMNVIFRRTIPNKAQKAWNWTMGRLIFTGAVLLIAFTMMLMIDAFVLLQFGRHELHFLWGYWPNTVINRVIGGMPLMLFLQFFLFTPLVSMADFLIGVGTLEGLLRKDGQGDGFVIRMVRFFSKLNGWHASGFALAALPPFHMWPELLAIGATIVPSWPYFCNAWSEGESEHLRRIKLSVMGWITMDVALLAILQPIVKAPFMSFYTGNFWWHGYPNWVGLVVTTVFLIQAGGSWLTGARVNDFDRAVTAEKIDKRNLRRLARRRSLIKRGAVTEADVAQLASMGSAVSSQAAKPSSHSSSKVISTWHPQPQPQSGPLTAAAVGLVIIGVLTLIHFLPMLLHNNTRWP